MTAANKFIVVVNNIVRACLIIRPQIALTLLNNIVDDIKQRGQESIVHWYVVFSNLGCEKFRLGNIMNS